ncbi:MAG: hypothetical protein QG673_714 [Pseudomonadota bacterium]|nr:hypothetical protein [Pseudomonadota bacterium]
MKNLNNFSIQVISSNYGLSKPVFLGSEALILHDLLVNVSLIIKGLDLNFDLQISFGTNCENQNVSNSADYKKFVVNKYGTTELLYRLVNEEITTKLQEEFKVCGVDLHIDNLRELASFLKEFVKNLEVNQFVLTPSKGNNYVIDDVEVVLESDAQYYNVGDEDIVLKAAAKELGTHRPVTVYFTYNYFKKYGDGMMMCSSRGFTGNSAKI